MEVFEVHITGDESIHVAAQPVKTIAVQLLNPAGQIIRTEHMTSMRMRADNYEMCLAEVEKLVVSLSSRGVKICRIKIECPFYAHYSGQARYIESHFETTEFILPVSRNAKKTTLLATDRTYDHAEFDSFAQRYHGAEVELCLFDSWVGEDQDWFDLYKLTR